MTDFALPRHVSARRPPPSWHRHLHGSELGWAIAFVVPYLAVFVALVLYPMAYGLWMGANPALYAELAEDPNYWKALLNTLVFVGVAVNVKMLAALLLSGFFMRKRRWIKALLVIYILPWVLPAVPSYLSFHWMFVSEQGLIDTLLLNLFGIDGPMWFASHWLALVCNMISYVWKWMPLWTLIFLAGRMAIPEELYDAARVDGAGPLDLFRRITVPLLANLYLISTLISTIWTVSDFTVTHFVSDGGPAQSTDVLATQGMIYALELAKPHLSVAAGLSIVPVMIAVVVLLMRKLRTAEVQL
ncbi:MAG TPA: sugar ABC transporter permease [Stellaceae bacterium]|nr:sugar ABC transporter permease [Stellaceae bacterium]